MGGSGAARRVHSKALTWLAETLRGGWTAGDAWTRKVNWPWNVPDLRAPEGHIANAQAAGVVLALDRQVIGLPGGQETGRADVNIAPVR